MKKKQPFDRLMLTCLNEKKYVRKLEYIIVEEGKRLLNSLKIRFIIVNAKDLTKWIENREDFKSVHWHQIGIKKLLEYKIINTFQYQLLITMKQALNKNDNYILRGNEFEDRKFVLECKYYERGKTCLNDSCQSIRVCPLYFKNTREYRDKQKGDI